MAEARIEVRTDDGTDVVITENSLIRELSVRPEAEAGQLLDEAVRRTRAALGLPAAETPCSCTNVRGTTVYDPECPDHGDQSRRRSTDR